MKIINHTKNIMQGFVMGIAEIVPGVSGSTLAFVMGIYDDLIEAFYRVTELVKSVLLWLIFIKKWSDVKASFLNLPFAFLIKLGTGVLLAFIILSNIIDFALRNNPQALYAIFFGILLGSLQIPWKELKEKNLKTFAVAVLAALFILAISFLTPTNGSAPSAAFIFFGGFVGICGMVLPGISGAMILLILGLYEYLVGNVKALTRFELSSDELGNTIIFILGLLTGFVFIVRLLKLLYEKYTSYLIAFILGAMIGSIKVLYPFFFVENDVYKQVLPWEFPAAEFVLYLMLIVVGFVAVTILGKISPDKGVEFVA